MASITAASGRETRPPCRTPLPGFSASGATDMIESEIVIVDDEGNQEPFDPSALFE